MGGRSALADGAPRLLGRRVLDRSEAAARLWDADTKLCIPAADDAELNVTGVALGLSSSPAFSVTSAPGLPGALAPG